jgi:SAM-dependent methyltransferase
MRREFQITEKQGNALVFAPERCLESLWKDASRLSVFKVDFDRARGIDLMADISRLPIKTASIDIVWCHHILEHIKDDASAIKELHRILEPLRGEMVISVPMRPSALTEEYGRARKEESGHWRMYGDDFEERLRAEGFAVRRGAYALSSSERKLYGIEHEPFFICGKARQASAATLN